MSKLPIHFRNILFFVSISLLLPLSLSFSFAQEASSGLEIEEIIVTAQKREESLQKMQQYGI